jgi:hypothetical protein
VFGSAESKIDKLLIISIIRNMKTIKLNNGYETIVDDEDYEWLRVFHWLAHAKKNGSVYAVHNTLHNRHLIMHRLIMDAPKGLEVDHINGNPLDNRRCNLRLCTQAQNTRNHKIRKDNSSGFPGVSFYKQRNKWRACINLNYRSKFLGYFNSAQDASLAYRCAAKKLFGEFFRDG